MVRMSDPAPLSAQKCRSWKEYFGHFGHSALSALSTEESEWRGMWKFLLLFWFEPSCVRVSIDMKVLHITDYRWASNRLVVMRSTQKVMLNKADSWSTHEWMKVRRGDQDWLKRSMDESREKGELSNLNKNWHHTLVLICTNSILRPLMWTDRRDVTGSITSVQSIVLISFRN